MKKPWSHAKKYGFGWGLPATWQGWIVFIAYIAVLIFIISHIHARGHSISGVLTSFLPQILLTTLVFGVIVYLTGEKPKWRWGNKR